MKNQTWS